MSFSSNRRDSLDPELPLAHRASHVRSCAMLVGQKWRVDRSIVIAEILRQCGVSLRDINDGDQITVAMKVLEDLRQNGMPNVNASDDRDASGRLSFAIDGIPIGEYPGLCNEIATTFGLFLNGNLVSNRVDIAFADFGSDIGTVQMAWDNWSGFIVTALSNDSEPIVRRIYDWLKARYQT